LTEWPAAGATDHGTADGRRALVTGGGGFIGSATVRALRMAGWRVRVLDDFSTGREENLAACRDEIEIIRGDVCDVSVLSHAIEGADVVFHQAAIASVAKSIDDPEESHRVNLSGTLSVLEAARRHGIRRIVYSASAAAYGDDPSLPKVETLPAACLSPYALQKYAGEGYLALYNSLHGLETVALRYFNVYGPGQDPESDYAAVVPLFIRAALAAEPLRVYGDGEQTRDFVYIGDVVRANLLAADAPLVSSCPINVASGAETSVNDLIQTIQTCLAKEISVKYEAPRRGDVRRSYADITRAKEVLGFTPSIGLADGLRRTIEDFACHAS